MVRKENIEVKEIGIVATPHGSDKNATEKLAIKLAALGPSCNSPRVR